MKITESCSLSMPIFLFPSNQPSLSFSPPNAHFSHWHSISLCLHSARSIHCLPLQLRALLVIMNLKIKFVTGVKVTPSNLSLLRHCYARSSAPLVSGQPYWRRQAGLTDKHCWSKWGEQGGERKQGVEGDGGMGRGVGWKGWGSVGRRWEKQSAKGEERMERVRQRQM